MREGKGETDEICEPVSLRAEEVEVEDDDEFGMFSEAKDSLASMENNMLTSSSTLLTSTEAADKELEE